MAYRIKNKNMVKKASTRENCGVREDDAHHYTTAGSMLGMRNSRVSCYTKSEEHIQVFSTQFLFLLYIFILFF